MPVQHQERADSVWTDSGVQHRTLEKLLRNLHCGHDYAVLAAVMLPGKDDGNTFVLLHIPGNSAAPYVVYRVDGADGSCHGGHYTADLGEAFAVWRNQAYVVSMLATRPGLMEE